MSNTLPIKEFDAEAYSNCFRTIAIFVKKIEKLSQFGDITQNDPNSYEKTRYELNSMKKNTTNTAIEEIYNGLLAHNDHRLMENCYEVCNLIKIMREEIHYLDFYSHIFISEVQGRIESNKKN